MQVGQQVSLTTEEIKMIRRIVGLLAAIAEDLECLQLPDAARHADWIAAETLRLLNGTSADCLFSERTPK